jgi:hypothetical protein
MRHGGMRGSAIDDSRSCSHKRRSTRSGIVRRTFTQERGSVLRSDVGRGAIIGREPRPAPTHGEHYPGEHPAVHTQVHLLILEGTTAAGAEGDAPVADADAAMFATAEEGIGTITVGASRLPSLTPSACSAFKDAR